MVSLFFITFFHGVPCCLCNIRVESGRDGAMPAFKTGTTVFVFNMGLDIQDRCAVFHVQSFHQNPVPFDAKDL